MNYRQGIFALALYAIVILITVVGPFPTHLRGVVSPAMVGPAGGLVGPAGGLVGPAN